MKIKSNTSLIILVLLIQFTCFGAIIPQVFFVITDSFFLHVCSLVDHYILALLQTSRKNPAYGRHRISRPMQIVGPIQFWRVCVIYLEEEEKMGRLTRPRVYAYTRPRVHTTDPRGGDGRSAATPRF